MLNKAKGRMFRSVGFTWNSLAGCDHGCLFCYAARITKKYHRSFEPQIREHYFKDKMPNDGSWIFVGSMGDTFCRGMKPEWIHQLLDFIENCDADNKFLLQTKNPNRFLFFINELEEIKDKIIVGTTLETTWDTPWSQAPPTDSRAHYLAWMKQRGFKTFLSLEPIADFFPQTMKRWINQIQPEAIEIGLVNYFSVPEKPSDSKIINLINWLKRENHEYILKDNLDYLYPSLDGKVTT